MHSITTKVTTTVTGVEMAFDRIRRKLVDLRRDEIGHGHKAEARRAIQRPGAAR